MQSICQDGFFAADRVRAFAALAAAVLTTGAAAQCNGDINNDLSVDGGDLGMLLGSWGSGDPATDLSGDGTTDGADLGVLLGLWGPCPPQWALYGKGIPNMQMVLQTQAGPRQVFGSAELFYLVGPPDANGVRPVALEKFTMSMSSAQIFTMETGGMSFIARTNTPMGQLLPDGLLQLPLEMDVHYWLLDQLHPPVQTECTEEGDHDGFTAIETWVGGFHADVLDTAEGHYLSGGLELVVPEPLTPFVVGGMAPVKTPATEKTFPGLEGCEAANKCNTLVVTIQPVFIGTGPDDATATGTSYDDMKAKAEEAWGKACISFEWLAPKYVDESEFKTLEKDGVGDGYSEWKDLKGKEDAKGENNAIEVFFVSHMQTAAGDNHASGDGTTYGSGTKGAKVIVSDDATANCDPKSDGVLAHELGHAIGNCKHPSGKASAAGTCMEPTGKVPPACPGVNNTKVNSDQITKARGSSMAKEKEPKAPCCLTPSP